MPGHVATGDSLWRDGQAIYANPLATDIAG
jgi:hypothetical protein